MGIIIYLVFGIIAEFVVLYYVWKRTAIALTNDPTVVFHYDNETTDEHLSIESVDVDVNDKIVKETAKAEISNCFTKNFKWWHILTSIVSLCIWPVSMTLMLLLFAKWTTDEDIVYDLLSSK